MTKVTSIKAFSLVALLSYPDICAVLLGTYSPVWSQQMLLTVFALPCKEIIKVGPLVTIANHYVRQTVGMLPTLDDLIEDDMENEISLNSQVLNTLTVGIAFGIWSPQLLLLASVLFPILIMNVEIVKMLRIGNLARSATQWHAAQSPDDSLDETKLTAAQAASYLSFATKLNSQIKVPMPKTAVAMIVIGSLELAIFCVLFDFGV